MNESDPLVCVIDDEPSVRKGLSNLLRSAGLKVQTFASAKEFLINPPLEDLSCLVLDVQLPGISGLDLQKELVKGDAQIPIIFLTGYGDIPMTVRAVKAGAINFLTKPVDDEDLLKAIRHSLTYHLDLEDEVRPDAGNMIGQSEAFRRCLRDVQVVAPTDAAVLIQGETGTGKELV